MIGRIIGSLIYSLIVGWKLTLVFLSMSPLIILALNITIKVGKKILFSIKSIEISR